MALAKVRAVKGNTKSTTATSIKPLLPTGAASGDLLFVLIVCLTKVVGEYPKVTTPEGWTRVGAEGRSEESEAQRTVWLYYREYDGSGEGFLPTFTADKESANSISAYCLAVEAGTFSKTAPVGAHDEWTLSAASTNPAIAGTTSTGEESLALAFTSWSTTPKEPEAGWVDHGGGTTTPGTDAIHKEAAVANAAGTGEPTLKKTGTKKGLSMMLTVNANLVVIKVHGGGSVKRTSEVLHGGSFAVHGGGRVVRESHVAGENRVAVHGGGEVKRTSEAQHLGTFKISGGGSVTRLTEKGTDPASPRIVQKGRSSGTAPAASVLLNSTALAGSLLVAFISTTATESEPTVTDNLGATWTLSPTRASYQAGALGHVWLAYKHAAGGETEVKVAPGAGGKSEGIGFVEVERASENIDGVVVAVNNGKGTSDTFPSFGTSNARDVVLAAFGSNAASGTVVGWTGTGPMTAGGTSTSRIIIGSLVPEAVLSGASFTATWTTSINNGGLVVAFLSAGLIKVSGGGKVTRTSYAQQGTALHRASVAGTTAFVGEPAAGVAIEVHGGGSVTRQGSVGAHFVHGGGRVTRSSFAVIGGQSFKVHGGGAAVHSVAHYRRISGGGLASHAFAHSFRISGGGRTRHSKFLGPAVFPSNAPRAGRLEVVHSGRPTPA